MSYDENTSEQHWQYQKDTVINRQKVSVWVDADDENDAKENALIHSNKKLYRVEVFIVNPSHFGNKKSGNGSIRSRWIELTA